MTSHPLTADPVSLSLSKTPPKSRYLIIVLGLLTAFGPLSIDMYLPAFKSISSALNSSQAQVQTTLAVFFMGMALGQMIYGPLSDHLGRKIPLYFGLSLYILSSLICTFAPNIETLIAARLLQALGGCAGVVISRAVVRDFFPPQEMAKVMSLLMLVMGLAPVLAPFFGGLMVESLPLEWGWRAIFAVFAGLGVLCLGLIYWALPESLPTEKRATGFSLGTTLSVYFELLKDRPFLLPALSGSMGLGVLFAYITGSAALFLNYLGLSPMHYSWIFAINAVGIIGGAQVNRRLLSRYSSQEVLSRSFLALSFSSTLFLIAVSLSQSVWLIAPALWSVLACLGFIMPNSTAVAMSSQSKHAGSASAILGMLQYAIGACSAGLLTFVMGKMNGHPLSIALILVLGSVMGWFFDRQSSTRPA